MNASSSPDRMLPATPLDSGLATGAPAHGQSPLAMIDDRLSGRWKPAIILGVLLGAALAVAGYRFAPVKYESRGSIRVAPTGAAILRETADTTRMPHYEGVLNTQAMLITTPRVIQRALEDEDLAKFGLTSDPATVEGLRRGIVARAARGTELIGVSFESKSPELSQIVVNAVLEAYNEIYGSPDGDFRSKRLNVLRSREEALTAERDALRREIADFVSSSEYGASNLDTVLAMKLERIEVLRQQLEELALAPPDANADEAGVSSDGRGEPTTAEIEQFDPELLRMRLHYEGLKAELAQLGERVSERHRDYIRLQRDIELWESKLEIRAEFARERWRALGGVLPNETGVADAVESMTPEQREIQRRRIEDMLLRNRQDVRLLNEDQAHIRRYEQELADVSRDLEEVQQTIRILNIESDAMRSGEITIAEHAVRPSAPSTDRRKPAAAAGFVGGLGLSMGLFFLLGTLDRRTYSARQLQYSSVGQMCLGVLPDLTWSGDDASLSETAAHCVHQIRNRLDASRRTDESFMVVVTSPFAGDGKTSVTMALGWSYAAAGYRTLLIDCDFVGRGLSRQLGMEQQRGLKEALRERHVNGHVQALSVENLSVLSVGADTSFGPESIRRDVMLQISHELRQRFDVILVDTGPYSGSVELLPMVASADGVLFAVRRGRSRTRLEECHESLDALGIPVLGVVLNCADQSDCDRYISKSVVSVIDASGESSGHPGSGNALVLAIERRARSSQAAPAHESEDRDFDD